MKHIKKLLAFAVVAVMMLSLCSFGAYAATQEKPLNPADEDNASITIMNPAKGETYSLVKVFDATVSADGSSIAYSGDIPAGLADYFEVIEGTENVKLKDGVAETALFAALETWAAGQVPIISAESDGSEVLAFTKLPYGYYVILTTHIDATAGKAIITVDSTKPNAEVFDKNATTIINHGKEADGTTYFIGDTITYTATFTTTNYFGSGSDAGKVYKYVIRDTLPEFLSDVKITSITIDDVTWADAPDTFDENGEIAIPWVDEETEDSLYDNGAELIVTYTAVLTDTVNVNGANKNTISIIPYDKNDEPYSDPYSSSNEITTYAAALKKIDSKTEKPLPGAKFKITGLTVTQLTESVEGEEKPVPGVYMVVSYDPDSEELGTEMVTNDEGMIYIVGVAGEVTLSATESEAPSGYNKLTESFNVTAEILEKEVYTTSGTRYYDADGNLVKEESSSTTSKTVEKNLSDLDANAIVVENETGTEMPSTGGIGTTIFYVVGSILLIGAAVVLFTKKRVSRDF